MAASSSAASASPSPSAWAPGSPARYGYAAETCRKRPSHGSYGRAKRRATAGVERAERVAVVAAVPRDEQLPVGLASGEVIDAGQLQGRLDRLRPARHRVDRRIVDGQDVGDGRRVRLERLGGEGRAMGIRQAADLVGHRIGDRRPPVADVDDDGPAGGIDVRPSLGIPDRRTARLDGDRRVGQQRSTEDPATVSGMVGHVADRSSVIAAAPWGTAGH